MENQRPLILIFLGLESGLETCFSREKKKIPSDSNDQLGLRAVVFFEHALLFPW